MATHIHDTDQTTCEDCVMPAAKETLVQNDDGTATLMCVKCPFCKQIVNAHMTQNEISCPKCKAKVTR